LRSFAVDEIETEAGTARGRWMGYGWAMDGLVWEPVGSWFEHSENSENSEDGQFGSGARPYPAMKLCSRWKQVRDWCMPRATLSRVAYLVAAKLLEWLTPAALEAARRQNWKTQLLQRA